ncbi:MAG: glutamate ligase domain-containing protein, partial [Hyphomicrobiaceae bacterium]
FIRNIPFYGRAIACIDHPVISAMIDRLALRADGRPLLTYGIAANADIRLDDVRFDGRNTVFDATLSPRAPGGARRLEGWIVPIPGHHNALNAVASVAAAMEAGIPDTVIKGALAGFSGVKRRFQLTGSWKGIDVFDDYGHHPIEIAAVLKAARPAARGRVFAVVEPHRYSRIQSLFSEFCACFSDADAVIIAPFYSAGEPPVDGINSATLGEGIRAQGHSSVTVIDDARDVAELIRAHGRPGDIIVYLGAGNSTDWAHQLPIELADEPRMAGGAV